MFINRFFLPGLPDIPGKIIVSQFGKGMTFRRADAVRGPVDGLVMQYDRNAVPGHPQVEFDDMRPGGDGLFHRRNRIFGISIRRAAVGGHHEPARPIADIRQRKTTVHFAPVF